MNGISRIVILVADNPQRFQYDLGTKSYNGGFRKMLQEKDVEEIIKIDSFGKLVHRKVDVFNITSGVEKCDLYQMAIIGVYNLSEYYIPHGNLVTDLDVLRNFHDFLNRYLIGRMKNHTKEYKGISYDLIEEELPEEAFGDDDSEDNTHKTVARQESNIEFSLIKQIGLEKMRGYIKNNFDNRDEKVLEGLFFDFKTQEQLSDELGISQQAISKRKRKFLDELVVFLP